MTKIYLIRHAEAEGNLYRFLQGQADCPLTKRGWRQAAALEKRFADIHVDAVYSSDLVRACATASAICGPKNLPLHRCEALREIRQGAAQFMPWAEVRRRWPERYKYVNSPDWRDEGGESLREVMERSVDAIRTIAAENDGKTVAVVSHGGTIRVMIAALGGYGIERVTEVALGDNTSVACLEAEGGNFRLLWKGDNSHLKMDSYLAGEKNTMHDSTLNTDLWYMPPQAEQRDFLAAMTESGLRACGGTAAETAETQDSVTLLGMQDESPVGVIRFDPVQGKILLLCVREDVRRMSFGVQLLGQAVQRSREAGRETLTAVLAVDAPGMGFLLENDFAPAETLPDGRKVMKKDLRWPEYA